MSADTNERRDANQTPDAAQSTSSLRDEVVRTAEDLRDEGRSLASTAADSARAKTRSSYRAGRDNVRDHLDGVASALQSAARDLDERGEDSIKPVVEQAARRLNRFNEALGERDLGDLRSEAEDFARRRPALFLGAAFGAGVLLGRFLTSSAARFETSETSVVHTGQPALGASVRADSPRNARAQTTGHSTGERDGLPPGPNDVGR